DQLTRSESARMHNPLSPNNSRPKGGSRPQVPRAHEQAKLVNRAARLCRPNVKSLGPAVPRSHSRFECLRGSCPLCTIDQASSISANLGWTRTKVIVEYGSADNNRVARHNAARTHIFLLDADTTFIALVKGWLHETLPRRTGTQVSKSWKGRYGCSMNQVIV